MNTLVTHTSPGFDLFVRDQEPLLQADLLRRVCVPWGAHDCASFGERAWVAQLWVKMRAIHAALVEAADGELVAFVDADVILLAPIAEAFRLARAGMAASGRHIHAQHDPDTGACMGFVFFEACYFTRQLLAACLRHADGMHNDQIVLNHYAHGRFGTFTAAEVGSYGNRYGGVWTGHHFTARKPSLAWHCNYVVGVPLKLQMRTMLLRQWSEVARSELD